jgi:hypothetical protein
MKKKYIIPDTQIILLKTKQPLLTMSLSDTETNEQFAPEYDEPIEF